MIVITQSCGLWFPARARRRAAFVPVFASRSLTNKQVKKAQGPATGDKVNKCAALRLIINKKAAITSRGNYRNTRKHTGVHVASETHYTLHSITICFNNFVRSSVAHKTTE
ncbi:unnamed protein product [Chrysodeixis includens]|uniref:Uncharacterized protein n=1 Tax=Chrysodeixis includens TaxID=689277 RepID=A0A9P0BS44_CHRIL|nr:unnamed protein product [Chrysodeixis includens]